MDDYSDWEIVEDQPDYNEWEMVQDSFNNTMSQQGSPRQPENFPQRMEDFYRSYGIHGANRGFAKIFGFGNHQKNTQQAYEQARETHPFATEAGNIGAQIYSAAPFAMTGAGAVNQIPQLAGRNLLKSSLTGGLAGAQMGTIETPYDDETRLGNIVQQGGYGMALPLGGKAITSGVKGIKDAGKFIKQGVQSKEAIAQGINKAFSSSKEKYSRLYGDLFEAAEGQHIKTNLPGSDLPKSVLNRIVKKATEGIDAQTRKPIVKAFKTNNPKDVHAAQSKLKEYIRSENKIKRAGGRIDTDALDKAKTLRKELGKELNEAFESSNNDLSGKYKEITKGYKKEVVPYSRNPAIQEHAAGDMVAKDFVKALRGGGKSGKSFRAHLSDQHPEIKANEILANILKGSLGLTGLGTGYGVYDYLRK